MYKMKSDINFSLTHEMLENAENERIHTSYAQEKAILECVSNGDIHALENTYYSLPTTVYGKMTSSNSKLKLLFYASIANTTLVTRYAIEGGLNEETAFSLSDVYIRKMEQCTDVDALMKLNEQMAIEFTLRVAEAKKTPKNYYSPAISRVIDYIYHGKNKTLTLNQLASLVNLTPKYLSALFHKETGQTLTVFIHKVLIEKAQNLLAYSDYSLGEISTYLNFSSQSYFISIFKRYTGITPGQYRKMHRRLVGKIENKIRISMIKRYYRQNFSRLEDKRKLPVFSSDSFPFILILLETSLLPAYSSLYLKGHIFLNYPFPLILLQ